MSRGLAANLVFTALVVGGVGWLVVSALRRFTRRDWRRCARLVGGFLVLAYLALLAMWWKDLHRNTFDDPSFAPLLALITLPFIGFPGSLVAGLTGTWAWKLVTDRDDVESAPAVLPSPAEPEGHFGRLLRRARTDRRGAGPSSSAGRQRP